MRPAVLFCALLCPAFAHAAPLQVTFTCERGIRVPVAFVDGEDGPLAIAWIEDGLRVMPQAISASGARYREAGPGYQFWTKGGGATISHGPDGEDQPLLSKCEAS